MSIAEQTDTVKVTLPDGSVRELPRGASVRDLAEGIGARLAKAAVAAKVDGRVVDLGRPLEGDARVEILTDRSPEALEVLRHSAAHILATAVRKVRPGAHIAFGPAIADGFYYDFDVNPTFTPEDLVTIQKEMEAVARDDQPFERSVVSRDEARELFADDPLKLERLEELGEGETITVYRNGPFLDLCRGPHLPSTGRLKHFRLTHTAGAYWRGDHRNPVLQRIYGTAFFDKKALDAYMHQQEEAKQARPPQARQGARPVPLPPVRARRGVLDAEGHQLYHDAVDLDARAAAGERLRRDQDARCCTTRGCGRSAATGASTRRTCSWCSTARPGEHDFSLKPMNCPSHHLFYGCKQAQLPRAAAAPAHPGRAAPQRGDGRARRPHPRAPVRAGRRAHLLHGEPDRATRSQRFVKLLDHVYNAFGLEVHGEVRHAPRAAARRRRACGTAPRRALKAALEAHRPALRAQAGRRRVLRPEDRLRRLRQHRPQVAAGHDPARLPGARALRPRPTSARTTPSTGRS